MRARDRIAVNPSTRAERGGVYRYPVTAHTRAQEHGPSWDAALSAGAKHAPQLPFTEAQLAAARTRLLKVTRCMPSQGFPDWTGALHTELTRNPRGGLTPAKQHGAAGTFGPADEVRQNGDTGSWPRVPRVDDVPSSRTDRKINERAGRTWPTREEG